MNLLIWLPLLLAAPNAEEFERTIEELLKAQSVEALDAFRHANQARDQGDLPAARDAYRRTLELVPTFVHAKRRLCRVMVALGERNEGLKLCEAALEQEATPENQMSLAYALLTPWKEGERTSDFDIERAKKLTTQVLVVRSEDPDAWILACEVAATAGDPLRLGSCSDRLLALAPESSAGYFYASLGAALNHDFDQAQASLDQARAHGMDEESYQTWSGRYREAVPLHQTAWSYTKQIGAPYLAIAALLALLGGVLSHLTLRSAVPSRGVASAEPRPVDAMLRRAYAAVLWLSCAFYYVSIPLLLLGVVAAAGGLIYAFLILGRFPIKLAAIVVIGAVVTVWALLKGLISALKAGKDEDPGEKLELAKHPKLGAVLREVAAKIGTRRVDNVYLEPGTGIAVMERGGMFRQLRGRSERCLILGVGLLEGMQLGAFKAILAHEYGHFRNEDTAGGGLALSVRRSMMTTAISLVEGGAASAINPAWLFFRGFNWIFLRISQGASRLQEILADRWAALAYGSAAFEEGLRHAIRRSVEFDAHVTASLNDAFEKKMSMQNLYAFVPTTPVEPSGIESATEEAINHAPSPFDSHPAAKDRIAWVRLIGAERPTDAENAAPVWSLFHDRREIETWMTDTVRNNLLERHGIQLPRAQADTEAESEAQSSSNLSV